MRQMYVPYWRVWVRVCVHTILENRETHNSINTQTRTPSERRNIIFFLSSFQILVVIDVCTKCDVKRCACMGVYVSMYARNYIVSKNEFRSFHSFCSISITHQAKTYSVCSMYGWFSFCGVQIYNAKGQAQTHTYKKKEQEHVLYNTPLDDDINVCTVHAFVYW